MEKQRFRKILLAVFWGGLLFTIGFSYFYMKRLIPDRLNVVAEETGEFRLSLPFSVTIDSESREVMLSDASNIPAQEIKVSFNQPFSLYSKQEGSYQLGLKLFGKFPIKEIQVDVVDETYAIPCGAPIGIYLKSQGVMVIGTGEIVDAAGEKKEPALGVLQSGDYIEAVNQKPLHDKETLITEINQIGDGDALLRVRRGKEVLEVHMSPVQTETGEYKLGAWVRDDTQGIGTLTYVDQNGNFGALGHGISDSDTARVVEIESGALYETEIMGIEQGKLGSPGVMAGVIYYGPGSHLGEVEYNLETGIFGQADERLLEKITGEAIPIGYRQDIQKGQAWIRSGVSGELKDYEIEIQRIDYNPIQQNKGLVIRVVDEELLQLTGGIIQGMSGSPIIQNGKLIGAVTHVFVQDPTRGYGIFVETMLEH